MLPGNSRLFEPRSLAENCRWKLSRPCPTKPPKAKYRGHANALGRVCGQYPYPRNCQNQIGFYFIKSRRDPSKNLKVLLRKTRGGLWNKHFLIDRQNALVDCIRTAFFDPPIFLLVIAIKIYNIKASEVVEAIFVFT